MSFFEELKRRKVFKVAATYGVVAWILMQIGEVTFPALNIPEWVMSTLVVLLLAGFPIAVIFAWIFGLASKKQKNCGTSWNSLRLVRWGQLKKRSDFVPLVSGARSMVFKRGFCVSNQKGGPFSANCYCQPRSTGAAGSGRFCPAQPAQSVAMHAGRDPHPTRREIRRSVVGQARTPSNYYYYYCY